MTERLNWRDLPAVDQPFTPPEDWIPSQTLLRTMDACDRAGYLALKYRGGAGSHAMNRGSLVHETIERLLRIIVAQEESSIAPEIGKDVLAEVAAENPHLQIPAQERDAARYLVDHWCRGTVFPNTIIGIETTFTLELEGFKVLARADLVEDLGGGVLRVTDWKTSHIPDSEEFIRQAYDQNGRPRWAGNYQLLMLAVLAHFGMAADGLPLGDFNHYRLRLGFPRQLHAEGIVYRDIEVDELQLAAYKDDLALQLRRLREVNLGEQKWQATPGNHCRECPAESECPLPPHLRQESEMADLSDVPGLEKAATAIERMSARNTTFKARLKKAALRMEEENPGSLDLGNGERGIRCGKDIAFVFIPSERETITDKAAYELHAEDVAAGRAAPEFERFRKVSQSTNFEKRKI